ncbi:MULTISPECIES: response regulator [unclassified Haloparvum]|uniref:response regulator n=1 Tax=Haloparvum sp. PAK95 TaxID=3418962 RepID=UPI003D2F2FA6
MQSSRVIVVDDEPGYAELIADRFDRAEGVSVLATVTDPDEVLDYLEDEASDVDCIVSDYDMPETDGLELNAEVQEVAPGVEFVLYTAYLDEELAAEAEQGGVTECFRKDGGRPQFQRLLDTVRAAGGAGGRGTEERGAG